MFEHLTMMRTAAETVAREFDPDLITGREAVRVVEEAGVVLRLVQGVLARAARRVAQTDAHVGAGDKDAAQCVARVVGVTVGEARRTIGHAELLAGLPATDAAVREGRLSARQTGLIVEAASRNPAAEPALLAAAGQGLAPLKDACLAARAVAEDPQVRSERHHQGRSLRMWTDDDGMLAGEFRLTPEAGGAVKALLDGETARRFRQHRGAGTREPHDRYAADALVDLLRGDPETIRGIRYSVHVVIGHGTLVAGGLVPGERCEIPGVGPVDPAWVRDLLGDAFLTAVITTGRRCHHGGASRAACPGRAADRDAGPGPRMRRRRLPDPRLSRDRSLRDRPRPRRADRPVEPGLALLPASPEKDQRLDARTPRSHHPQADPAPTRRPRPTRHLTPAT